MMERPPRPEPEVKAAAPSEPAPRRERTPARRAAEASGDGPEARLRREPSRGGSRPVTGARGHGEPPGAVGERAPRAPEVLATAPNPRPEAPRLADEQDQRTPLQLSRVLVPSELEPKRPSAAIGSIPVPRRRPDDGAPAHVEDPSASLAPLTRTRLPDPGFGAAPPLTRTRLPDAEERVERLRTGGDRAPSRGPRDPEEIPSSAGGMRSSGAKGPRRGARSEDSVADDPGADSADSGDRDEDEGEGEGASDEESDGLDDGAGLAGDDDDAIDRDEGRGRRPARRASGRAPQRRMDARSDGAAPHDLRRGRGARSKALAADDDRPGGRKPGPFRSNESPRRSPLADSEDEDDADDVRLEDAPARSGNSSEFLERQLANNSAALSNRVLMAFHRHHKVIRFLQNAVVMALGLGAAWILLQFFL